ncbi:MAG: VOC family protein [Acidimicrobiales bacterium]
MVGGRDTDDAMSGSSPVMPADLSMVVLSVRDMPALRRYYRALGWCEQAGGSDTLSTFELGGVALTLHPQTDPIEARGGAAQDRPAVTFVVRVGASDDVDAACSSAVRAGARALSAPRDQPWGGRSGLVADPEGNRWELLWVPLPSSPNTASRASS